MKTLLFAVVITTFVAGCVAHSTTTSRFYPNDFAFAAMPGTSIVSGTVFYRENTGGVAVPEPQQLIYLIPKTTYTTELLSIFLTNPYRAINLTNTDRRLAGYIRVTPPMPGGQFIFSAVPPGQYYILASVYERYPALISGYNILERVLIDEITVYRGQNVRREVSNQP